MKSLHLHARLLAAAAPLYSNIHTVDGVTATIFIVTDDNRRQQVAVGHSVFARGLLCAVAEPTYSRLSIIRR